ERGIACEADRDVGAGNRHAWSAAGAAGGRIVIRPAASAARGGRAVGRESARADAKFRCDLERWRRTPRDGEVSVEIVFIRLSFGRASRGSQRKPLSGAGYGGDSCSENGSHRNRN